MSGASATHSPLARRTTADGRPLELWSDGTLTSRAYALPGIGRARTPEMQALDVQAGWLVLGEAALWDLAEVAALTRRARALVRSRPTATPGDLRAAMR